MRQVLPAASKATGFGKRKEKKSTMGKEIFELIAPCHFGMEAVLKREINDLGYEISKVENGKVTFLADAEGICRGNIFLRTTERILLKVAEFKAETFDELFENKVITSLEEIEGVGHRVVHGGSKYASSIVIDDDVIAAIKSFFDLAPLHNPANLLAINAFTKALPSVKQVAVFDTSFQQTMEPTEYIYPVPYEWYTEYGVRRYGFHGISHNYLSERMSEILGKKEFKLITCHLGGGCSIEAIENGKCVDASLGFSPNAGLMMGTRCGDIDSQMIPYVMNKSGMSLDEVMNALNKKSGLLGISGVSSDSRDIEAGVDNGDERCILAQQMFVNRCVDYIAKYYVKLGGADAICFAAGLGENSITTRKQIIDKLAVLGIKISDERNDVRGKETLISSDDSTVPVWIVPTDEELMIAKDTYKFIK